jgi:hypothetical protein
MNQVLQKHFSIHFFNSQDFITSVGNIDYLD